MWRGADGESIEVKCDHIRQKIPCIVAVGDLAAA
jgi:hypothetical protein